MPSKVLQPPGRVLLHLTAATVLCSASAALVGGMTYRIATLAGAVLSAGNPFEFFVEHIVVFAFVSGVLAGWVNNWKFPHISARWVRLIPTVLLALQVLSWHDYSVFENSWRAIGSHFFGDSCQPPYSLAQLASGGAYCFDQLKFTAPFCSSLGYAAGALAEQSFHKEPRIEGAS